MTKQTDRRDLALVRESGSTTRVLDLGLIAQKYGDSEEYRAAPLFRNQRLNGSLILKHTLRVNERGLFNGTRITATKVLFPFTSQELRLGGAGFFVGESGYERLIRQSLEYKSPVDLESDVRMLLTLDSLPSFDPFLMRERLRQEGIAPARCYFSISDSDMNRMQSFVSSQIAALVEIAFAGQMNAPRELSVRLAEKLMTNETAQSLEPLRATLRLSGEEYREGVFAWKGFLYYKWVIGDLSPRMRELGSQMLSARILNADRNDLNTLNTLRQRIIKILGVAMARVHQSLKDYDEAFDSLSQGKPTAFRDFLLSAPKMFLLIGEAVGILKHIESFWRFRFPPGRTALMEVNEAYDIFEEFDCTLSGISALQRENELMARGHA